MTVSALLSPEERAGEREDTVVFVILSLKGSQWLMSKFSSGTI